MERVNLRDELHEQVLESVKKGAPIHLGREISNRKEAYYPATILTEVKKGMPAYHEELFSLVATVIRAKDEKEVIEIANDTIFGLGPGVFTKYFARGERISNEELEAGSCFVNQLCKLRSKRTL